MVSVSLAADIDPHYAACALQAVEAGVDMYAFACRVTPDEITVTRPLPLNL